jgi:hypothetical protein
MEWRRSVYNSLQTINLDCFIKSTFLGDVFYNLELDLGIWVCLGNLVGLCLGTNCGGDLVSMFKEDIENVSGDEARASYYEICLLGCCCREL